VYTGCGLTLATATAIVAYEPMDNHSGFGTNVLFGDNHVEWIDKKSWPSVATAAGVAVVLSLATRQ
jgi:prepilin-type processing-associated H-X9-DG protein